MKFSIFILTSFLLCSCASTESSSKIEKAEIYYNQGTSYLIDKQYTSALDYLLKAQELNPKEPKILTNLGMAYFFKGQEDQARKLFLKALDYDPKYSDARNNLASLYVRQKKYIDAEREYKVVAEDLVYPNQFRTYYNLGYIFYIKSDFKIAKSYLLRSIQENENHCPAHFLLGEIYLKQHEYKEAYNKYLDASKGTCFNDPAPHYYQAIALEKNGEYEKALKKLSEMTEKFKKSEYSSLVNKEINKIQELQQQNENRETEKNF
ncbi:MAG: tetratricopeptide repeat protein [Bacteriovoracaceae bacterium]